MSVFGRRFAVAFAILTVLVLVQVSGQPARAQDQAQDECAGAEALRKARLHEEALAAYVKLLQTDKAPACAVGNIETAAAAVSAALEEQAQKQADQAQQKELAAISTLLQQGRFAEATTAIDEYRKQYPDAPLSSDITPAGYYTSIYTRLDRSWITIQATERLLLVLVDMLATVVLGLLLLLLVWVTAGRVWGFVRARLEPSLQVEAFTGSSANVDVAALVRVALHRYSSPGGGNQRARSLNLVTGPVDAISLPEVKSAPESTQIFTSMLNWLLPPHIITLTGKIQPAGIRGIGISLELTDSQSKRQLASYTLWQDEFEPDTPAKPDATDPKPYLRLAEPAAVWAMFAYFQDRWEHGPWWQPHRRLCLSGTSDWQSYALLQAGTNWVRDKDREKGQQLYRRALTKDPRNYGALTNLASLAMQEETADDDLKQKLYESAVDQLTVARHAMQRTGHELRDPAWYVASYRLGIAESELERLHRDAVASGKGVTSASSSVTHAQKSLVILAQTFDQVTAQWEASQLADALGPIRQLQQVVLTLFLWLWRHLGGVVGGLLWCSVCLLAWMFVRVNKKPGSHAVRVWRSRRAPWSQWGVQTISDEISREFLNSMRFGVGFSHARARAEFLGDTQPIEIIKEVEESGGAGLTAREYYNLACYYAQRAAQHGEEAKKANEAQAARAAEEAQGTSFTLALHALESGLGLPNGVADTWPLRDSALKPLHDHEPSKARFAELLKTYNGVPEKDPDPLAELRGVGSYHASQLKKHGYGTPESLRALANDYARQTRLAKDLSVSHSLVLRWLRLALMYHVAGQASGVVNLLELAGVETLYELARQKADELAKRLGDLNQDPKLVETAPTAASIQPWIDAAKAAAR